MEFVYAALYRSRKQFYHEIDTKIATRQQVFTDTLCGCQSIQLSVSGSKESATLDVR